MSRVFIDTNILVRAARTSSALHRTADEALGRVETAGDEACISRQILREFLATVTRPQADAPPLPASEAASEIRRLMEIYTVLEDGPLVTEQLLHLLLGAPVGGRQIHDANIAATMLSHGVSRLLTFNAVDFRRFEPQIELIAP